MKKHLRILYGADDRFYMTMRTLWACADYFDTVRVVNSGPKELEQQFYQYVLPANVQIETLVFFCGDLDVARRAFLYDVDNNDWVLWLDADERPSQLILDHLDDIICDCEKGGMDSCFFPASDHIPEYDLWGIKDLSNLPSDRSVAFSTLFMFRRFFKKTSKTYVDTNFGGHGAIYNMNFVSVHSDSTAATANYRPYPINHYKSDKQIYQSGATSIYFNPVLNITNRSLYAWHMQCKEYLDLRKLRLESGVITQNDLCRKLHLEKDEVFKAKLNGLFLSPLYRDTPRTFQVGLTTIGNGFWHAMMWADKYDLAWDTPKYECPNPCCRYTYENRFQI